MTLACLASKIRSELGPAQPQLVFNLYPSQTSLMLLYILVVWETLCPLGSNGCHAGIHIWD